VKLRPCLGICAAKRGPA